MAGSHCQRPNGRESREHGRRLFPPLQVVPWSPEAARARGGGCCVENETDARSSVAPRTGRVTTSTARRRCAWTGVGCAAAWTQVSIWRRRRKHGVGWPPILARAARGTRESGAADASGQRHERRELARVPLWPVAAVVGSELSGIRIRIEASVNRACELRTSSLAGPVAGLHNWFLLRRVRTRRLAATCEE